MKKFLCTMGIMSTSLFFSQVGINTATPQASLDIHGKNHLGAVTANDGVLVPRVNSLSVSGSVNGQLVYLIQDNGSFTKGFYYWDGTIWKGVSGGDATKDAWVDNPTGTKVELGTLSDGVTARPTGTELVANDNGNVGIGISIPTTKLDINGDLKVRVTPEQITGLIPIGVDNGGNVRQLPQSMFRSFGNYGMASGSGIGGPNPYIATHPFVKNITAVLHSLQEKVSISAQVFNNNTILVCNNSNSGDLSKCSVPLSTGGRFEISIEPDPVFTYTIVKRIVDAPFGTMYYLYYHEEFSKTDRTF